MSGAIRSRWKARLARRRAFIFPLQGHVDAARNAFEMPTSAIPMKAGNRLDGPARRTGP